VCITIKNKRKLNYVISGMGIPLKGNTRSDIYVSIRLLCPLHLQMNDEIEHVLKEYFS
jgi:hypothetical protein